MHLIDEFESDVIKLIGADIDVPEKVNLDELWYLFLDWMHFQARQIVSVPRAVYCSNRVNRIFLKYPVIFEIGQNISNGRDLRPWLSRKFFTKNKKVYKDLLFNDWGVSHFHLGSVLDKDGKVSRTRDLLFCYIDDSRCYFIDVFEHGRWADDQVLKSFYDSFPEVLDNLELKGALPPVEEEIFSVSEKNTLRKSGATLLFIYKDKVFLSPGLGLTTSKHATRISILRNDILNAHHCIIRGIEKREEIYFSLAKLSMKDQMKINLKFQEGQFIIYEYYRNAILYRSRVLH